MTAWSIDKSPQTDGPKAERPAPMLRANLVKSEPRPTQSELAIPGLPEAAAEASDTRARLEGERLTLRVKAPPPRPLDDRLLSGPLFRGTAASPQDELFKEEPCES